MSEHPEEDKALTETPSDKKSWPLIAGRILAVLALVGGGALAAGFATEQAGIAAEDQSGSQSGNAASLLARGATTYTVTVDTTELQLVCPGGVIDPDSVGAVPSPAAVWVSDGTAAVPLDGGGRRVDPGVLPDASAFPSALSLAGSDSGSTRSLLLDACQIPANQLGFTVGSTVIGENDLLTVSNPSAQPVSVVLNVFDQSGAKGTLEQALTVPAHTTTVWRPAVWFPDVERMGMTLQADGPGVAAWLQSSSFSGEVPQGLGRVNATVPSRTNVFPLVVDTENAPVLSLLNPTDQVLPVKLEMVSAEGKQAVPGTENLRISPGTVAQVNVGELGVDNYALIATTEEPIFVGLSYRLEGEASPLVPDEDVEARTLVAAASPTNQVHLPPLEWLYEGAAGLGITEPKIQLAVLNLTDAATSFGPHTIPAGGQLVLDAEQLASDSEEFLTDSPVYVALQIEGQTPLGPVMAVTVLTDVGTEQRSQQITMVP